MADWRGLGGRTHYRVRSVPGRMEPDRAPLSGHVSLAERGRLQSTKVVTRKWICCTLTGDVSAFGAERDECLLFVPPSVDLL